MLQTPYEAMVREDAVVGSTVLPGIKLVDEDQVGDNIKIKCEPIKEVIDQFVWIRNSVLVHPISWGMSKK